VLAFCVAAKPNVPLVRGNKNVFKKWVVKNKKTVRLLIESAVSLII
jgi:hypothetical protein